MLLLIEQQQYDGYECCHRKQRKRHKNEVAWNICHTTTLDGISTRQYLYIEKSLAYSWVRLLKKLALTLSAYIPFLAQG